MTKLREFRDFREILKEDLQDTAFAAEYINEAIASGDKKVFLTALRDVIEARGSITDFAQQTDIPRQSIYRMLSEEGNPTVDKLAAIFEAMGFRIQVVPA